MNIFKMHLTSHCRASISFCSLKLHACAFSQSSALQNRTALYDFHKKMSGKMVNFAGYELPVKYIDSISSSHLHTREHGGIFDVSHMMQCFVRGKHAAPCIESICTADLKNAAAGSSTLTVFTNDNGGILDDLIVTKVDERTLYIVSNAAMRAQDTALMQTAVAQFKANGSDVSFEVLSSSDQSLIAVQGPAAAAALSMHLPAHVELSKLYFMHSFVTELAAVPNIRITRCGYTGEDGFELSLASEHAENVVATILQQAPLKLAGLGARDTLRLEAGLCLYGADINAQTTPVEAGLTWLIAKQRRSELNFPGAATIAKQLKSGVKWRRVGFKMLEVGNPPARAGTKILFNDKEVGHITSGAPSPSLKENIAMGYIMDELKNTKSPLDVSIRGKLYKAKLTAMPFVKPNYYVKPKA